MLQVLFTCIIVQLEELNEKKGKVTNQYYVFLRDNPSAEVSSGNLTRLYERFMAQALNATDDTGKLKSNRLAALLNFDMGDVSHEYTEDITSTSSEIKSNSSEKAVNKKIISNILKIFFLLKK